MLADAVDSGEKFLQPGGVSEEKEEGDGGGGPEPFIGVARRRNGQAINRIKEGD
jgi:hypothetical protein